MESAAQRRRASSRRVPRSSSRILTTLRDKTAEMANAGAENSIGEAIFVRTDVTENDSVATFGAAADQFGKLDILHNNAGGSTSDDGPIADVPDDEFWRAIKLDLYGTFLGCRHAIPAIGQTVEDRSSICRSQH